MRGLPQELLFALLFGAVLLLQFLYRALRQKAASMQEGAETGVPPAATVSTPAPAPPPETAARPVAGRMAAPTPAPTRVAPRTLPRVRRYSRAALMPDRRAVQDAIVIAAILQPCHANRARDIL